MQDLGRQGSGLHGTSDEGGDDAAEIAIVDTPGAITDQLRVALTEADAVAVPVCPSVDDVGPTERTLGIVEEVAPDVVGVLAVNGRTRFLETREFEPEVERWEARDWNVFRLPQTVLVPRARRQGEEHSCVRAALEGRGGRRGAVRGRRRGDDRARG